MTNHRRLIDARTITESPMKTGSGALTEVPVAPRDWEQLAEVLSAARAARLRDGAEQAELLLRGRTVWNVSSTAGGGGVAEMLHTLVGYVRGAGMASRWLVIRGDADFFTVTKRVHNLLHGSPGDGGRLGADERRHYDVVLERNLRDLLGLVAPGDIVLLHDPQTAGMARGLGAAGVHVVWRCHVGRDEPGPETEQAWAFLRPHVQAAEAAVFSRQEYVPPWLAPDRVRIISPSLDPLSVKNRPLASPDARAALQRAGLVKGDPSYGDITFMRGDGTRATTRTHAGLLVSDGPPVPARSRTVVQVSRWDRLKDMAGVLRAFAEGAPAWPPDVHLVLAGPDITAVADDPEGRSVLSGCLAEWGRLPDDVRSRAHLVCLPMDDLEENAHLVNALQQTAAVVVQKSLAEGFGLTVAEAMWKARPVVATAVGGIRDQVEDGVSGLLLHDPSDLRGLATMVNGLLLDEDRAARLGRRARERVRDRFLPDRHLLQYADLFAELLGRQRARRFRPE